MEDFINPLIVGLVFSSLYSYDKENIHGNLIKVTARKVSKNLNLRFFCKDVKEREKGQCVCQQLLDLLLQSILIRLLTTLHMIAFYDNQKENSGNILYIVKSCCTISCQLHLRFK